jgi:hypothetical protein
MPDEGNTLSDSLGEAAASLQQMAAQLKTIQAEVQGLGFFARGFVEKDISGATGRSLGEWVAAATALKAAIAAATNLDPQAIARARQTLTAELPRIAALRGYLQRAPQKVNAVPAAVLKPQRRAEFLDRVEQEQQELQALEGQLSALAEALASAG